MIYKILIILSMIIIPLLWGYDDGYMKRKGTENHRVKWLIFLCIGFLSYYPVDFIPILGWLLMFKPLFDIGWSAGAGYKYIYIGSTSWTDIILHWLGLVRLEKTKFPAITFLYLILFFVGCSLTIIYG